MNTWNTMPLADANKLRRILHLLETLTHEDSIPVIAYLQANENADFLELLVHTGLESRVLQEQLEWLCACELVLRQSNIVETHYALNRDLYGQLARLAEKLAGPDERLSSGK